MPGFCNATQCLHQVSKLTAGRYHLATAFTYHGTIDVRRTMSLIGTSETWPPSQPMSAFGCKTELSSPGELIEHVAGLVGRADDGFGFNYAAHQIPLSSVFCSLD
jgi:hypothetical protein